MSTCFIELHDRSKLEFEWLGPDALLVNRWLPGSEYYPVPWLLAGCTILHGTELAQFITALTEAKPS